MKKYGHTGTLFIQGNKYKWSYKYETCVGCKTVKYKHKGNGYCTSCFDKIRRQKSKTRQFKLKIQGMKYWIRKRALQYLEKKAHKKKQKVFDLKSYKKQYYENNKIALRLISRIYRLKKKGVKLLKININGKYRDLPFTEFAEKKDDYELYKKQLYEIDILKKYYCKKHKKK